MQWLIDIIRGSIREYGMYEYRGDPPDYDFTTGDFTIDSTWHELSLFGLIDKNAHLVNLAVIMRSNIVNKWFGIRRVGQTAQRNSDIIRCQVPNIYVDNSMNVSVTPDAIIEYRADSAITDLRLTVRGWWY